jgi:hypothetical protein
MAQIGISWGFSASVVGGPQLAVSQPALSVDAYDVIKASVPAAKTGFAIDLQPATAAGEVRFLAVTSDNYTDPAHPSSTITYKVDLSPNAITLDGPLLLVGAGAVSVLNGAAAPPQKLHVDNNLSIAITLQILVGRMLPP